MQSPMNRMWCCCGVSLVVFVGCHLAQADTADTAAERAEPVEPGVVDATPAFVAELKSLLDLGLEPDVKSISRAETHFRTATNMRPDDPRVEYAYALVLHRLFQSVEAVPHLKEAADSPDVYFPANQSLVRELIRTRKYLDAEERLAVMANSLATDDPQDLERAKWIGRIVACVAGPVGSKAANEQFQSLDGRLRRSLSGVLEASYERGFQDLEHEFEELQSTLDVMQADAAVTGDKKRVAINEKLAKNRETLQSKREETRDTVEKWNDWVQDETRKIDEILFEMEKSYADLERSVTAQTANVASMRLYLNDFGSFVGGYPIAGQFAVSRPRRADVIQLLLVEEQKLELLYAAQSELSQRASRQLNQRKAVVAEYQKATGQALKETKDLSQWNDRMKRTAERAKKKADKTPGQVASLESRIRNLSTYDPFDFSVERERLLAEYGVETELVK